MVTALIRRLLAVLLLVLLAGGGVVLVSAPASACPASTATPAQQVEAADALFTGTVSAVTRQTLAVHYTVQVERVYKGDVGEQATVMTQRNPRACGLPGLVQGGRYVFYAADDGGDLVISSRGGTTRATAAAVATVERLLGPGTSPVPPEPETATFTTVAGEPASRTRLAAPGAALVLVGLLGLVLVGSLGRRRRTSG